MCKSLPMADLIGSKQAAEILGVDRSTFLRWVADGLIEPEHELPGLTGSKLFRVKDVERLRAEKAQATA